MALKSCDLLSWKRFSSFTLIYQPARGFGVHFEKPTICTEGAMRIRLGSARRTFKPWTRRGSRALFQLAFGDNHELAGGLPEIGGFPVANREASLTQAALAGWIGGLES